MVIPTRLIRAQEPVQGGGSSSSSPSLLIYRLIQPLVVRPLHNHRAIVVSGGSRSVLALARAEPGVFQELLGRRASLGLHHKHAVQEMSGLPAHVLRRRPLPLTNLLVKFLVGGPLEREMATEQGIEEDACCPDIGGRP